jgi:hypothetical protein
LDARDEDGETSEEHEAMRQTDPDDPPNLNSDPPWSEIDVFDLANCIRLNQSVEEIADFLCRSRREVREKIGQLERTGEFRQLVDKAAAHADTGISIEEALRH